MDVVFHGEIRGEMMRKDMGEINGVGPGFLFFFDQSMLDRRSTGDK
jgi:hypothetical protein